MKMKLNQASRIAFAIIPVLFGITFARATPDEMPCAVVMKAAKGVQVIPPEGRVQTRLPLEAPVACGSMLITHAESFWIRLTDQTVVKVAPHSFIEIPKSSARTYRIYRGAALVTAPPGIYTQTWSTPNAESIFKGGIAFIQYGTSDRLTTVGCFNRNFEFKNKFNAHASQVVHAGETSHLMIQDAQVTPTQPAVMSHPSVVEALAGLQLPENDHAELVAIVKNVFDERAKSLASEIQDWEEVQENQKPSRSIASVKPGLPVKAVDPKEANFVNAQLRAHLYGDEEDQKSVSSRRNPASAKTKEGLVDHEKVKQQKNLKLETKKLEKEIEQVNSED